MSISKRGFEEIMRDAAAQRDHLEGLLAAALRGEPIVCPDLLPLEVSDAVAALAAHYPNATDRDVERVRQLAVSLGWGVAEAGPSRTLA